MSFWTFGFASAFLIALSQAHSLSNLDDSNRKPSDSSAKTAPKKVLSTNHLRKTYVDYCAHCHGLDGRPASLVEKVMPEMPDFSRFDWSDYETADVVASIADGTGQMPGFKAILTRLEMESLAIMITKFPSGKPLSLIQKRSRYLKADLRLLEKAASLEDELQSLRDEAEIAK